MICNVRIAIDFIVNFINNSIKIAYLMIILVKYL